MPEKIQDFIIEAIEEKNKLPINCDLKSFNYIESGYIDSISLVKFILNIETKFDIELTESDIILPDFKTIGGLVELIKNKIGNDRI